MVDSQQPEIDFQNNLRETDAGMSVDRLIELRMYSV
jgi:hypothetical protein